MRKFTVIAYADGDYCVHPMVLRVEAESLDLSWDAALKKVATEMTDEAVLIPSLTEIITFDGWLDGAKELVPILDPVRLKFWPQADIFSGFCYFVESPGEDEWNMEKADFLTLFPARDDFDDEDQKRDDLRSSPYAPEWVREWSGPFEVRLACDARPWGDEL